MKGRFEKPRNRFSADSTEQQPEAQHFYGEPPAEDNIPQNYAQPDIYSQESSDESVWQQNPYENQEYEVHNQNAFYSGQPPKKEKSGWGWGLLCFFIPPLALILYFAWKRRKPRSAKSAAIGGLVGIIIQLVLVLVLIIGGSMYYNSMLDKVNIVDMTKPVYTEATEDDFLTEAAEKETETVPTEPQKARREDFINFLLVGQASRANEEERFADTMLVCTLNKFDNSITVTSLLRDSFVQPPAFRGHNFGHIKLTTVYHLGSHYDNGNVAGSMELINNTLFSNFGLEIDYNVEISFEIFEDIVNELGGVDIELNEAECKYLNNYLKHFDWAEYHVDPGMNHLDGFASLAYARMRKADGDGESDIKRTARQRKFMEALMTQVKAMSISDLQGIAEMILPQITTNMTKREISDMLSTVLTMLPTMEFKSGGTCPANYSGAMVDIYDEGFEHSVLKFNVNETKKTMRELTLGEVPEEKK